MPVGISLSPRGLWHVESDIGSEWVASRWALHGPYGITIGREFQLEGDVEDRDLVRASSRRIMQRIGDLAHESQARLQAPYLWPSLVEPLVPVR